MTGSAPLSIVAVHGVGNSFGAGVDGELLEDLRGRRAAVWAKEIAKGLGVGPDRLDLDFAYYADRLAAGRPVAQGDDDELLDDPLARRMLEEWARELGVADEVSQGHAAIPVRALSSWVARKFDLAEGPLRIFIRLLFREVATYLRADDAPERLAAREEVAARIAAHRPRVVIAHSLGSVVAYEALHAHPELRPELFLTLGSPLAMPRAVFDRLVPRPEYRGTRPPGATRWVNIADPGDPVAVPPGLSGYFEGIALDHTSVVGFHFDLHNAVNYLRSATTAATLAPYTGG
ncbi:serine peptidase [Streptomyces sp. NPDC085614]|uniref:serine peptidase n=1 Tax=Streptomyces sp. NPDC085614 TaxID=3365733 RepID=UPI0037CD42F0